MKHRPMLLRTFSLETVSLSHQTFNITALKSFVCHKLAVVGDVEAHLHMEASLGSEIEQVCFSLLIGLDLVGGRMPYRHSCAVCGVVFVHLCRTA